MNECLNCGKLVKNKYCNVSCQNKHQNKFKFDKKYGQLKKFEVLCNHCGKEIEVEEREKLFPKKDKYYCSRSCSNSRTWTDQDKEKKSKSLKGKKYTGKLIKRIITKCKECAKEIEHLPSINRMYCSVSCSSKDFNRNNIDMLRKAGLKSSKSQNKRSKNEIYFSELCKKHFKKVLTNESIFNGWDADVIIEDLKIAVLWNGVWHYKKITEKHSLKQVQNRDKIKLKEIEKAGYKSYIIKDMGKYNKDFVYSEFEKFKKYIAG